jgi:DNA-directed RNA polymerase specialized sigma24 family protein
MPRKPKPSFDEFIRSIDYKVNAIVGSRVRWLRPQDKEDVKQEILMHIWKKWPTFNWDNNPEGLAIIIAFNVCTTIGKSLLLHQRKSGHKDMDDITLGIVEEESSKREWLATKRSREAPPPQHRPWIDLLLEEDKALCDMAQAIARSGNCRTRANPGYKFWMEAWMPASWDAKRVIYHWQHRIDNARVRFESEKEYERDEPRNERSAERLQLLEWTRHHLPNTIRKIESGALPGLRKHLAKGEIKEWRNRLYELSPYTRRGPKGKKMGRTHKAELLVPDWVFKAGNEWRACGWFRRCWRHIEKSIREFGWLPWAERQLKLQSARSMEWQCANADKVKARLRRPEVIERRRTAARNWNRAHPEACSLAHKRWFEKLKSDASSGLV